MTTNQNLEEINFFCRGEESRLKLLSNWDSILSNVNERNWEWDGEAGKWTDKCSAHDEFDMSEQNTECIQGQIQFKQLNQGLQTLLTSGPYFF